MTTFSAWKIVSVWCLECHSSMTAAIVFCFCMRCDSEEWRWLVNEKLQANSLWLAPLPRRPTDSQHTFETELRSACERLLAEVSDGDATENGSGKIGGGYRLYDVEVLELNADVSFVIVLPPSERVCDSPLDEHSGDRLMMPESFSSLPVQAFEMRKSRFDALKLNVDALQLERRPFTRARCGA
jgi:hypothetical protein